MSESERELPRFAQRLAHGLHKEIKADKKPVKTHEDFVEAVSFPELALKRSEINYQRQRFNDFILENLVNQILDSNAIKMTDYLLRPLFDGANEYSHRGLTKGMREAVIDGHLMALGLGEPMDRVIDRDEGVGFLDDYRFVNPYILRLARKRISEAGDKVLSSFEEGFKEALKGQHEDVALKREPLSITDERMIRCYQKYRAMLGTAGRNMALDEVSLAEVYYLGVAKAGEAAGCGNEFEDSGKLGQMKIPSWPLYYALQTDDVEKALDLTLRKGKLYLNEARIALDMILTDFPIKPFLETFFYVIGHYIQSRYAKIKEGNLLPKFREQLATLRVKD